MLLQPFLGTVIALRSTSWDALIALTCVVFVFLIREPLAVLAKHKWNWSDPAPEMTLARKRIVGLLVGVISAGVVLLREWPWQAALAFAGIAGALTVLSVRMSLQNRQHELWFQILNAAGLSASGLVACFAIAGSIPAFGWWWWGLHTVHFLTWILVIHVQSQARVDAQRTPGLTSLALRGLRRQAQIVQGIVAFAGLALVGLQQIFYGLALLASSAIHFRDIASADSPQSLATQLDTLGKRALALSLVFTALLVWQVWSR